MKNKENEIWKISIRSNYLEVSNIGNIRGIKNNKSVWIDSYGYKKINIFKKSVCIHTLVLETFVGPRPNGLQCRHLDGNKLNNRLDNLKWGTAKENGDDTKKSRILIGRITRNKIKKEDVLKIRKLYKKGFRQCKILKILNLPITASSVQRIVKMKSWKYI